MQERVRTVAVALILCLNIGVDPPDTMRPAPCAHLECWIDPAATRKAVELIAKALQAQYEAWHPKARYRQVRDPTVEEVRKWCMALRRAHPSANELLLLHYNGHGVPKPTASGEIWAFNSSFTQYLPLAVSELQSWLGSPSLFVFDCSNAGRIVDSISSSISLSVSTSTVSTLESSLSTSDSEYPTALRLRLRV